MEHADSMSEKKQDEEFTPSLVDPALQNMHKSKLAGYSREFIVHICSLPCSPTDRITISAQIMAGMINAALFQAKLERKAVTKKFRQAYINRALAKVADGLDTIFLHNKRKDDQDDT